MYHIQFMKASFDPRIISDILLSGTSIAVCSSSPMLFPYTPISTLAVL